MYLLNLYRQAFTGLQRNVWIISVATLINRSGSMVLLFASLYFTRDLGFNMADAGLMMSFYGMGSIAGSYIGGWLTDRKHFFDVMVLSLICSGAVLLLLPLVKSFAAISAIIFFYALVSDSFRPANAKAITAYSQPENRTRSVSLIRMAMNLGFSVGPAAGGFIALYLGYHWLFIIDACTSFAAAWMLFTYLPRVKTEAPQKENAVLNDSSTSAYRDWGYLFFILLVSVYGICFFQLFASMPQYFSKVCGYNEDTIGLLLALNGALVVIIEMPLILVLEKKNKPVPFIVSGVLCTPLAFLVLILAPHAIAIAVVYTLIITLSEILAMPFMMNFALSRPQKERQGQYAALYSISFGLANIAAPSVGLSLAGTYGFDTMLLVFVGLGTVTAAGFLLMKQRKT